MRLGLGTIVLLSPVAALAADVSAVDRTEFLTAVAAQFASGHYVDSGVPSIMGQFFHTGDADQFIAVVDGWLEGVVIDPDYLDATQGAGTVAFTQPSGWTGFSQSMVQSLEQRYNGYVILRSFDPNIPFDVATVTHEAIHAYAQATGLTALDSDDDGVPEFLSAALITNLMPKLHDIDMAHFEPMFVAAWECEYDTVEYQRSAWLTAIAEQRYRYANFSSHNMKFVDSMLSHWGGRLDWDAYEHFVETIGKDDDKSDC